MITVAKESKNPEAEKLEQIKRKHKEDVRTLMEAIENGSYEKIQVADVLEYHKELLKLKHSGPKFKEFLEKAKSIMEMKFPKVKIIPINGHNELVSKLNNFSNWNCPISFKGFF